VVLRSRTAEKYLPIAQLAPLLASMRTTGAIICFSGALAARALTGCKTSPERAVPPDVFDIVCHPAIRNGTGERRPCVRTRAKDSIQKGVGAMSSKRSGFTVDLDEVGLP
jgi:hypothetical protein